MISLSIHIDDIGTKSEVMVLSAADFQLRKSLLQ
jgi:hypothetical protein